MGSPQVRVKVKISELIAAIEAHAKECEKEYEKALKAYKFQAERWPKKAAHELRKLADDVERNPQKYTKGRRDLSYTVDKRVPHPPFRPTKPQGAKRQLKMLRMSPQETIMLSESTFRYYFDSCAR